MILWLAAVPFAFIPTLSYHSIYVAAIMAYMLFGFEEIGVEIENPFGHDFNDLPVDAIIRDLQAIVEDCKARVDEEAKNAAGDKVDVAASSAKACARATASTADSTDAVCSGAGDTAASDG
jgi:predicted membrane chloride channel (bestrophin family)